MRGRDVSRTGNGWRLQEWAYAPIIEVKTHREPSGPATPVSRSEPSQDRWWPVPVLSARQGGPAERLGNSFGRLHPAVVFVVAMLAGLAAIAVLSIGLGFLITRVVEHAWGIGAADQRVSVWLATHRTSSRTDASLLGSIVAGGVVLPIVVGSIALVCAVLRKWRIAAFVVFALAVESATYRATTFVVHSHRPRVVRLEHLAVNASYPSGHTAASIAVYGGLVLLLTSRFTSGVFRASAWTIALALVTFVATARMYRGMHHPLDVAGGVAVGIAAVIVLVFACRTAGAAVESRNDARASVGGRT
jgi:membrane-associated phospholipid phosphatase